jgi:hypothetical protein
MASTYDVAFIEEFEAGVHLAYQRMGSKMRNTVRTANGVKSKTTFQKAGKGAATTKDGNAVIAPPDGTLVGPIQIPAMELVHTNVPCIVEDWFAAEWVDDLDQLRMNHNEMQIAMESGAYALGRKTDEQIIAAAETTTSAVDSTTTGADLAWATALMTAFGLNDVPDDGQRYCFIGWENWGQLLSIPQFASADYVPTDQLPFPRGTQAKNWLSFMWIPHSGLSSAGVADVDRVALSWHRSAIGHAIGDDVSSNMQYYNIHDSWFVLNKMQMNACLIDATGCFTSDLIKSPA